MATPIRPNDDEWMVREGLRQPKVVKYNFAKTKEEKAQLAAAKLEQKTGFSRPMKKKPESKELPKRLIVYVRNISTEHRNKFKTTYSFLCQKEDVKYTIESNLNIEFVTKVYFGGKLFELK